jgi:PncC family amidohydrolase
MFSIFWSKKEEPKISFSNLDVTVSVAESVTAGALINSICSEPGSSKFFKGGIVPYTINSKKELLNIDVDYAEANNHANPFTTLEMAKAATKMFKSRIGLATTGYSLPYYREENKELNLIKLDIKNPYVLITLYDSLLSVDFTIREEFEYKNNESDIMQRAKVQAVSALKATNLYKNYVKNHILKSEKLDN